MAVWPERVPNGDRLSLVGPSEGIGLEPVELFGTHVVDDAAQLFELRAEPLQLVFGDAVVARVARLDVGVLELLEAGAIALRLARSDMGEAGIDALSLGAQEPEVVDVGGVEGAYEQHAMVEPFCCLVHVERSLA